MFTAPIKSHASHSIIILTDTNKFALELPDVIVLSVFSFVALCLTFPLSSHFRVCVYTIYVPLRCTHTHIHYYVRVCVDHKIVDYTKSHTHTWYRCSSGPLLCLYSFRLLFSSSYFYCVWTSYVRLTKQTNCLLNNRHSRKSHNVN